MLFRSSLLVAPVFEQGATERKVYLPAGGWYDFWTAKRIEGETNVEVPTTLETMPLFVRAGSILPTGPVKQYVAEPSTEPVRLTVYPGSDAHFQLYDDDGLSFAYEKGAFAIVDLKWDDAKKTLHYSVANDGLLPAKELTVSLAGGEMKRIVPRRVAQTIEF